VGSAGQTLQDRDPAPVHLLGLDAGPRRDPKQIGEPAAVGRDRPGGISHAIGEAQAAVRPAAHTAEARRERGADEPRLLERLGGDEGYAQTIRSRTTALA
jgi:hypothetical protein